MRKFEMKGRARFILIGAVSLVVVIGAAVFLVPALLGGGEPAVAGGQQVMRRLTPSQYVHIVGDIFGEGLSLGGRFEPEVRANGLLAVGAGQVSITATGFEQYYGMARTIASQVVDPAHRTTLVGCQPASATGADDGCAQEFLGQVGRLLFRRPLTSAELQSEVAVAREAAESAQDFYAGLGAGLTNLLISPNFLFRHENLNPESANRGEYEIDAFAKASRLSFLLWDTAPDDELLRAAESGELDSRRGLRKQVERMIASPRLETGVRAFFSDMLLFDQFSTLSKDSAIYPKFVGAVVEQGQEQTLRTIVDHLVKQSGDYRDLFTTRKTFLTPTLGALYGVPVASDTPVGAPERWYPVEYQEGDPRIGILTHISFIGLHSHPGRSSPTLRGKAIREIFLCQKVPDPPGDVSFTVVQDTTNHEHKTARDRATAHRTEPACAGCHKIMDPIGLGLENFDSAGGYRVIENGAKIDISGDLDGVQFTDMDGLGKAVHENAAIQSCIVNRAFSYATGHAPAQGQANYLDYLKKRFAESGYRFTDLLADIVTSDAFFQVDAPPVEAQQVAQVAP